MYEIIIRFKLKILFYLFRKSPYAFLSQVHPPSTLRADTNNILLEA